MASYPNRSREFKRSSLHLSTFSSHGSLLTSTGGIPPDPSSEGPSGVTKPTPDESFNERKAWANRRLSYGIALLRGEVFECNFGSILFLAIYMRNRLLDDGWPYQARILGFWIDKAKARGDFLRPARAISPLERGGSST